MRLTTISPAFSVVLPGPALNSSTGTLRRFLGLWMLTTAPAATSAGTESAAGEALHRLPPGEARPWTWVEPIRLIASTTPGQAFLSFLCSPITAAGVAAPMVKLPLVSVMLTISGIFLTSMMTPGAAMPAFICTSKSVPPARIRPLPLAPANRLAASRTFFATLY